MASGSVYLKVYLPRRIVLEPDFQVTANHDFLLQVMTFTSEHALSMNYKYGSVVQSDQLNMVVFFWYFGKSFTCTVACTGQVTFYKVPEKHGGHV